MEKMEENSRNIRKTKTGEGNKKFKKSRLFQSLEGATNLSLGLGLHPT